MLIDRQLVAAGWVVQDKKDLNLYAAQGGAAEVRLKALTVGGRLPFVFEASGTETHFTNGYDPEQRARRVFAFPKPSTLARILRDAEASPPTLTWRGKVHALPELDTAPLRPAQTDAILGVERSLTEQRFEHSLGGKHP